MDKLLLNLELATTDVGASKLEAERKENPFHRRDGAKKLKNPRPRNFQTVPYTITTTIITRSQPPPKKMCGHLADRKPSFLTPNQSPRPQVPKTLVPKPEPIPRRPQSVPAGRTPAQA